MQLKKLTMQAFGPFKDKVVIDFEKDGINKGLLLITGDTGAGKTTIFDAICFALYGEASGNSRKVNSLRSDFAPSSLETYVELEFYHNNKKYVVKRSPEYMRKSKRGDGFTKQVATAEFTINGRMETKTNVVTSEITTLLGLDYKQFHQVAMLSQGEFTKFLLASSDEKTSIFRKIFNTDIYSDISSRLKENLSVSEQKFNQIKDNIEKEKQKLTDVEYSNLTNNELIDTLDIKIREDEKRLDEVKKTRDQLNEKITVKKIEINKINDTNKKIHNLDTNKKALEVLENNNLHIEEERSLLEYNINVVPKIRGIFSLLNKEKRLLEENNKKLVNSNSKMTELSKTRQEMSEKYRELDTYTERVSYVNSDLSIVNEDIKKLTSYEELSKKLQDNEEKLKASILEYEKEYGLYEVLRRNYYLDVAYSISENLKDNDPCPVCGSAHHPKKAERSVDTISKEDLEKQENKFNQCMEQRKTFESLIDTLREEISKLNLDDVDDIDDIDKKRNELLSCKDDLSKKLDDMSKEYNRLTSEKRQFDLEYTKLDKEIELLQSSIKTEEENIKSHEDELCNTYQKFNTTFDEYSNKSISDDDVNILNRKVKTYDSDKGKLTAIIELLSSEVEGKAVIDVSKLESELQEDITKYDSVNKDYTESFSRLDRLTSITKNIKSLISSYNKEVEEYSIIRSLSNTANGKLVGKQKITFENYVQSYYLNHVLCEANKRLTRMSDGRYDLRRKETATSLTEKMGLEFLIFDAYTGKEREVSSLSGGEKFKTALSLALGLSDVISMFAGGIKMDALFVDEGFGSLDQESLNQALNTLSDLVDDDKLVGIISHVSELISRIDKRLVVKKNNYGSYVQVDAT